MSLALSIVDQRVGKLADEHSAALGPGDPDRLRSRAFVLLVASTVLDVSIEEALALMTDGGQDAAIDALHVGDLLDGEFLVTLVQGKYKRKQDGAAGFPANEIGKVRRTVEILFDPDIEIHARPAVLARIEEIRSLVRDGAIPRVRVVLCNNGARWAADGQAIIDAPGLPEDQVVWDHVNHDALMSLLQAHRPVADSLRLVGAGIVEALDFCRVFVGKVSVTELARLFEAHGDRLLERNIRRYLGLRRNRVNRAIAETLSDRTTRSNFYFFNNGVTLTCRQFRHNALQDGNFHVKLDDLQIINGGQTCHTIHRTLTRLPDEDFSQTYVMLRIYELDEQQHDLVHAITYAANSQNPVDLRDLRANDETQRRLEMGLSDLGYTYERKRDAGHVAGAIMPTAAAEAVLAVWRRKPHLARFRQNQLFGALYSEIFSEDLTPAQVVIAVEILRLAKAGEFVETERFRFRPYATHFVAMLVGQQLVRETGDVSHRNLGEQLTRLHASFVQWERRALAELSILLFVAGIDVASASLQRLSGAFRRGTLLENTDAALDAGRRFARQYEEARARAEELERRAAVPNAGGLAAVYEASIRDEAAALLADMIVRDDLRARLDSHAAVANAVAIIDGNEEPGDPPETD